MVQRILTSIFGIALVYFVNYYGGLYLKLFGIALTIIALFEYFLLYDDIQKWFMYILMIANGFIFLIDASIFIKFAIYFILLIILAGIKSFKNQIESKEIIYTMFSFTYITMPIYMLISLRSFENGKGLIWLPYLICWATDSLAYLIGIKFGKRRIWSKVSPKKSLEGLFGGLAGGVIGVSIYLGFFLNHKLNYTDIILYIFLGILLSLVAQIGDLFASILKRENNKKDFGFILPGHGGVLDRFDSMLLVVPVVFILAYIRAI